jgi:hypothetical protein
VNSNKIFKHDFTTFIDDILAVGLAVLRYLLWHLILCLFRLFLSKWHKIPVAGFVRLGQTEIPAHFPYDILKTLHPGMAATFWGCYIRKDFPLSKNVCKDTAHAHITITNFFTRQHKIVLYGKFFPMQRRPPSFSSMVRRQVINNEIRPCFPYKIKVLICIHDGNTLHIKAL